MEIKEQTPSVIARLLGFYESRHQPPSHKQYRVLSEDYLRKCASIDSLLKQSSCNGQSFRSLPKQSSCNGRSFRLSRVKMPESKDVFEGHNQQIQYIQTISKEKETLCAVKKGIRFEKQNFKDAQCSKLDEKFLDSLKFSDTLENVRYNKKISLKHLPKRDSLFPNHSHDQICTHSPFGQSTVFKMYDDSSYRKNKNSWKPEKTAVLRKVLRSPQKLEYDSDTLEDLQSNLQNISRMRVKVKNRIPVIDEARDTRKPLISLEPCKHSFATSRKTVIETEVSRSVIGTDDNSVNQTKTIMPFGSSFYNLQNQEQASYPYSNWSTITREGKNTDAGWRRRQVGTTAKFSTVCELLYSPDQKRPERTYKLYKTGYSEESKLSQPLGVNSKYSVRKDVAKLSRFRSSPSSPTATMNSNSKNQNDGFRRDDKYTRHEEAVTEAGNRFRNQHLSKKGMLKPEESTFSCEIFPSSESGNRFRNQHLSKKGMLKPEESTFSCEIFPSSESMDLENNHSTEESLLNKLENILVDKSLSEEISKKSEVSHISVSQDSPTGSPEDGLMFSSCFEFEPELSSSWRDTHQPSPNSVLNPPYEDEILSDIECFEGVGSAGANLIGLWKQLQLLKSDVEDPLSEAPGMMVSSDEGTRDVSDDFLKENGKSGVFRAIESRDYSYLVDVLDETGFYDANWEINVDKWDSPDSAVNPSVFEALEKKYGDQISWEKYERRILFDRINSGLMEILQPCLDIPEWANSFNTWLGIQQKRDVIEEKLWNLLVNQEKEVNKGLSEKAIGSDMSWLKLGGDIDIIVKEIENFLFNELVAELGNV